MMLAYAILIGYYHGGWKQLPQYTPGEKTPSTFISVVIAARNEEKNINDLLASLRQQDYPASLFEIIIVDDHSTDNTWNLLQEAKATAIKLDASGSYKKFAIETGIKAARGTLIVTTDADCRFNTNWLGTLASFYEEKQAKFIAAPVVMKHQKGLLSLFQSLDFITLQGITAASVHKRFHSMCNGANLAYERAAFFEVNGFAGIDSIPTGDDMLLMHKIYRQNPEKVFYLKSSAAIVETEPAFSWPAFFQQRIRWASKADQYNDRRIMVVLWLVYLLNLSFLVMAAVAFWKSTWLFFMLLLLLAKILIEFPFVQSVARFFGRQPLMWYFPFLQPLHISYTIIAGWLGRFGSYTWKERKVKRV
jgi:cellulose synthase/poly-beta-1,6-N-acetylglucosamine synthase-like glycosyltransferase